MKSFIGFAGFGGVDLVHREFGFNVLGIEVEPNIAKVNQLNGGNVLAVDILSLDPRYFGYYNFAHFSPPCPNFSIAKTGAQESEIDIAFGRWIARFIRIVRPEYFTLENVWMYRKSLSWLLIWYTLLELGYGVNAWNLNTADYGVPQTRKRMIVIARRDGRQPAKPFPTHSNKPDMFTDPWVGWYEAIVDLIPDLPETRPADWQMDRLPKHLKDAVLAPVNGQGSTGRRQDEPSPTITAQHSSNKYHAFLLGQGERSRPKNGNLPADTVTANTNQTGVKAFIIGGQYQNFNIEKRIVQNKPGDCPVWTITANENSDTRAYTQGRWVSMTPRCLARFQSFPDNFKLPGNRGLAYRGIGNAVPPRLYRAILTSL